MHNRFNGSYPYIDVSTGGRIDGLINGADRVLALIDNQTKIIPGHGALAGKAELKEYRDMLADVRNKIASLIQDEKSVEEIIDLQPTSQYDAKWGNGFMQPDQWVSLVHASMSGE